jgi:hypothetical protein
VPKPIDARDGNEGLHPGAGRAKTLGVPKRAVARQNENRDPHPHPSDMRHGEVLEDRAPGRGS